MTRCIGIITVGLAIVLGLSACRSSPEDQTGSATPAVTAQASPLRGKQLYEQQCARCHAPEPIRQYSRQQWLEILPRMTRLTRLTPQQSADVTAYVMQQLP